MPTHPAGITGKSMSSLGANSAQTLVCEASSAMFTSEAPVDSNKVFQNLISSIEAHNMLVRKLNKSKCY